MSNTVRIVFGVIAVAVVFLLATMNRTTTTTRTHPVPPSEARGALETSVSQLQTEVAAVKGRIQELSKAFDATATARPSAGISDHDRDQIKQDIAELQRKHELLAEKLANVTQAAMAKPKEPAFRIHVLTYNRHESLQRLLRALAEADYEGDFIHLKISVDWPKGGENDKHRRVVDIANSFEWKHGSKEVKVHAENQGLVRQWLECWLPQNDDEKGIIFEDDLEPSVVYYKWLKKAWAKYGDMKEIIGISLQRQYLIPAGQGRMNVQNGNNPYLYKLVGSWGYAPLAHNWRLFQQWQKTRPAGWFPDVPGLVTTEWYRSMVAEGRANTMWTQWHIKYCDERGLYTLYANLANGYTMCSNHQEPGEHFGGDKSPGVDHPRAPGWEPAMDNWPDKLQLYDWAANQIGTAGP